MKHIKLGFGPEFSTVDDSFEFLSGIKWFKKIDKGYNCYAATRIRVGCHLVTITMHRYIMCAKDGQIVDHINGDGLDNRTCNLRIVTNSQNMMNRKRIKPGGLSKYKGVTFLRRIKKWSGQISVNKNPIYIGVFNTEDEAALAYNELAKIYHKEYARLNIIED